MYECENCGYLDRGRKEMSENGTGHYIYGCNCSGRSRCVGWIKTDGELKIWDARFGYQNKRQFN